MFSTDAPAPEIAKKRGVGRGSRFMVLDRALWERVCAIKHRRLIDVATAFLVLLAGTGSDHRLTKWSAKACEQYTGMNKANAWAAFDALIEAGLVERTEACTRMRPQYRLAAPQSDVEPIFLPNQLVTGFKDEAPILRRVRETGDPLLLVLLVELYGAVTLDAPHAVAIKTLRSFPDGAGAERPPAKLVSKAGVHAVWELAPVHWRETGLDKGRYAIKGDERTFWTRIDVLAQMGAIYGEEWLCSSAEADAEAIHPLVAGSPLSASLNDAAHRILCGPSDEYIWRSDAHPGQMAVLPGHHQPPAVQGFTRMRVEADTPGRRAAFGERERIVAHWIGEYTRLAMEAAEGNYANPVRTQVTRQ